MGGIGRVGFLPNSSWPPLPLLSPLSLQPVGAGLVRVCKEPQEIAEDVRHQRAALSRRTGVDGSWERGTAKRAKGLE